MKIKIKNIPAQGLDLNENIDPADIGLKDKDLHPCSPLKVHAHLNKVENEVVLAEIRAQGSFTLQCGRCLESFDKEIKTDFTADYEIDPNDEYIELDDDIRQEVILAIPFVAVCKEDCQVVNPQQVKEAKNHIRSL